MNIKVDIPHLPFHVNCPFCEEEFELDEDFMLFGECPHYVETGGDCAGSLWIEFDDNADADDYIFIPAKGGGE